MTFTSPIVIVGCAFFLSYYLQTDGNENELEQIQA